MDPAKPKCRLAEIIQYSCKEEYDADGVPTPRCWPVPRIFRLCPGRPAVEVTRYVNVDMKTGEIDIPSTLNHQLPKAKPWRDVKRYASKEV
ncbi:hypothetical protein EUX98_g4938 [Antrodiella citrinella]|uniref:Uncharacterized protein n=1 Tax=Antrodiella citrinella TaxID=2447956 RepID=A0A4S4MSY7_9APHY|nr:hypothetical protein EUX98_g4938 [Antrodiella citrinella]